MGCLIMAWPDPHTPMGDRTGTRAVPKATDGKRAARTASSPSWAKLRRRSPTLSGTTWRPAPAVVPPGTSDRRCRCPPSRRGPNPAVVGPVLIGHSRPGRRCSDRRPARLIRHPSCRSNPVEGSRFVPPVETPKRGPRRGETRRLSCANVVEAQGESRGWDTAQNCSRAGRLLIAVDLPVYEGWD
jgi:hypothetical protein